MAALYFGRSLDEGRPVVALKVIRPEYARDMNFLANVLLDEAKLTSRLSHPSIVKIYEQASHDGKLFIAMELLFGQSLATVWEASQRGPPLPPEIVAFMGARVATVFTTPTSSRTTRESRRTSCTATSTRATSSSPTAGR